MAIVESLLIALGRGIAKYLAKEARPKERPLFCLTLSETDARMPTFRAIYGC
jgi:hypothetical protein